MPLSESVVQNGEYEYHSSPGHAYNDVLFRVDVPSPLPIYITRFSVSAPSEGPSQYIPLSRFIYNPSDTQVIVSSGSYLVIINPSSTRTTVLLYENDSTGSHSIDISASSRFFTQSQLIPNIDYQYRFNTLSDTSPIFYLHGSSTSTSLFTSLVSFPRDLFIFDFDG